MPPRSFSFLVAAASMGLAIASTPGAAAEPSAPTLSKAHSKGRALMAKGDCEAAIRPLEKARKQASEPSVDLLLDLATCANNLARFVDAEAYARKVLEQSDAAVDRGPAYNHLGLSLFGQAKQGLISPIPGQRTLSQLHAEMETAFREVLEMTGGQSPIVWYNLGQALKLRGKGEAARDAFNEYLEREPKGPYVTEARRSIDWIACEQGFADAPASSDGASGDSATQEASNVPTRVTGDVVPPVKKFAPGPSSLNRPSGREPAAPSSSKR
ncbi:MAG: tetratricopeptide repeat protein [Acidobacteriota bacterium]